MTELIASRSRILIAPDCFGETLSAVAAGREIAAGWSRARPADELVLAPQSDGGPGFIDVLTTGHPELVIQRTRVAGPLAGDVEARWALDQLTTTAYIESAQACGLHLLGLQGGPPTAQTALAAHSFGVGQLISAALDAGAGTVVVGLGGTACTDGGKGMAEALGGIRSARQMLAGRELLAATDVDHPLLGPAGAARVFGPQKGADPATVELLEARLVQWAQELVAATGADLSGLPGAGAAGGLGAALLALGGRRLSGATLIAERTGLAQALRGVDLLITGEGRLDEQSLSGKVVGSLAATAKGLDVPVLVLAGQVAVPPEVLRAAGVRAAYSLAEHAGSVQRAMAEAAAQLRGLAFTAALHRPGLVEAALHRPGPVEAASLRPGPIPE